MNAQFHTPSFGDEVFDLTDLTEAPNVAEIGRTSTTNIYQQQQINSQQYQLQQQQQQQSKRVRSMDNSIDEYHSANDESFHSATGNSMFNNSANSTMAANATTTTTLAARKQLTPTDPNEPAKPLSAYALFFRDTVSAIKQQNPNCSFQELSRIVASMWEALDPAHKNVYNKKNEIARNEYIKQMRNYRQQQSEQQQQQQQLITNDLSNNVPLHTKPAVFTIARNNSDGGGGSSSTNNNNNNSNANVINNFTNAMQQNNFGATAVTTQQQQKYLHQQQQFDALSSQQQQPNYASVPINAQNTNLSNTAATSSLSSNPSATAAASTTTAPLTTSNPSPQQMQMLTEAGSVQKCTRDNCNKMAIINPDWEDEYCSNECVVIHCRNVFNAWVQSNLDARKQ